MKAVAFYKGSTAASKIYFNGKSGGGSASPYLGLSLTPTHYINKSTGNDANDGLTPETAWANLGKVNGISISSNQTIVVRIATGTYNSATDDLRVGLTAQTNVTFYAVFEPGCIIDGVNFTLSTQNGVSFRSGVTGGGGNRFYAYGNGCQINNVTTGDGNGLDGSGAGTGYFHDFSITNARDGISMHEDFVGHFYDVSTRNCLKWAVAHVGASPTYHYRCSFADENNTATLGGLVSLTSSGGSYCEDCTFLPGTSIASRNISCQAGLVTFERCRLGTLSRLVDLAPFAGGSTVANNCFINAAWDGIYRHLTLTRCYGKLAARTGPTSGGGSITVEHCVLSGPATGRTHIIWSNYNPGSCVPFYFRNNIFETPALMYIDAVNAGYLVAAGSDFHNNVLSGTSAFDNDITNADTGGTVVVGNITADALIGAANTMLMTDYAFGAGSPAIGAATDGSDSGFGAADVVVMRTRSPALPEV